MLSSADTGEAGAVALIYAGCMMVPAAVNVIFVDASSMNTHWMKRSLDVSIVASASISRASASTSKATLKVQLADPARDRFPCIYYNYALRQGAIWSGCIISLSAVSGIISGLRISIALANTAADIREARLHAFLVGTISRARTRSAIVRAD